MVLLHVVFKLAALLLYLLAVHSFITTFILVTLLLSADFWAVKNICGRLLAGLRWWSIVDEEGEVDIYLRKYLTPLSSPVAVEV